MFFTFPQRNIVKETLDFLYQSPFVGLPSIIYRPKTELSGGLSKHKVRGLRPNVHTSAIVFNSIYF